MEQTSILDSNYCYTVKKLRVSLEHVTGIHPPDVRERTGYPGLSDAGDRSADISERSDTGEGRPSCTEPDDGSCSSDALRVPALNASQSATHSTDLLDEASGTYTEPWVYQPTHTTTREATVQPSYPNLGQGFDNCGAGQDSGLRNKVCANTG